MFMFFLCLCYFSYNTFGIIGVLCAISVATIVWNPASGISLGYSSKRMNIDCNQRLSIQRKQRRFYFLQKLGQPTDRFCHIFLYIILYHVRNVFFKYSFKPWFFVFFSLLLLLSLAKFHVLSLFIVLLL